jgi:hypothetical protein
MYEFYEQQRKFLHTYPPMKMEQTVCSETLAYKIQMPGNYPEESIQHTEHGESLKSRTKKIIRSIGYLTVAS